MRAPTQLPTTVLMEIGLEEFEAAEGADDERMDGCVVDGCGAVMWGVVVASCGAVITSGPEDADESTESEAPSGGAAVCVIATLVTPETVGGMGASGTCRIA